MHVMKRIGNGECKEDKHGDEKGGARKTLGARAPITSGHMLNTLRIHSISDHNVSSGQKSDKFKMYPVMLI